jgi:chromosome partitioning protein
VTEKTGSAAAVSGADTEIETDTIPRAAGRVLAIANQKGGVGKTTTAINLATALAATGRRVMLFDLDPQGNASTGLGVDRNAAESGSYEVLIGGAAIDASTTKTAVPHLVVVPASVDLSGAELELVDIQRREYRLKDVLDDITTTYDYVLIDCPPSLGLLTLNALVAADGVVVPLQCEYLALEGLSQLVRTVERVHTGFNDRLAVQGIVLTMFDSRNNLSNMVADDVRSYFGDVVYNTVIPRNVRISEAPSYGKPVLLYDFDCLGSQAYVHLAVEFLRREEGGAP